MILVFPVAAILFLQTLRVAAQDASPLWRKSNITTSTADRISLVAAALDSAIDRLGADGQFDNDPWGTTANLFSQMAEFDIATNQTKEFGHAAAKAFVAYKNPTFLQYAIESWWTGRVRTLSDEDVSSGKTAVKDFSIAKTCPSVNGNTTMVGGTFWRQFDGSKTVDPTEPSIAGVGTGYFLVVSALLAEATNDPLYLQAAIESADFIHSHLFNIGNIVQDFISASTVNDTQCQITSYMTPSSCGVMIEGLAVLASVTKNSSIQSLDLLVAVIPDTSWQGANGVIARPDGRGDMNLLQGLGAAYTRNLITPALRQYVGAYIAVQFNAVIDLATSSGTNIYGASWTGPPSTEFSGFNQTLALAALISAMGVSSDSAAPSSSSASAPTGTAPVGSSPSPNPSKNSHKLGAVLGGVLGAVAIAVIFGLWLLHRHRSRTHQTPVATAARMEPFMTSSNNPLPMSSSTSVRLEKRGLDQHPPSIPSRLHSTTGEGPSGINSSAAPTGLDLDHVDSTLPTEALVELLNRRLRNRQWDEGEMPPEYPITEVGSSR
ncbi:hypothetical protein FB451DRAFT_1391195 [Mycena latifolia]|nr:hypothetical protein FB451DRAFT_1391195 [Mycena latifolia]